MEEEGEEREKVRRGRKRREVEEREEGNVIKKKLKERDDIDVLGTMATLSPSDRQCWLRAWSIRYYL